MTEFLNSPHRGQGKVKSRTPSAGGVDPQFAAMFFNEGFGKREAQPHAALEAVEVIVDLGEALEDGFKLQWINAGAGICNGDLDERALDRTFSATYPRFYRHH